MACPEYRYPYRWPDLGPKVLTPDATADNVKQFLALMDERDRSIEDFVSGLPCKQGGGGLRFSTVTVKAHDSVDTGTDYDYVCTGSGDETTINTAALHAASAGNGAGEVILSEGNFNLGDNGGAASIIDMGICSLRGLSSRHDLTTLNFPTTMAANQVGINCGNRVSGISIEQSTCSTAGVILVIALDADDIYISANLTGAGAINIAPTYQVRNCFIDSGGVGILLDDPQNRAQNNYVNTTVGLTFVVPSGGTGNSSRCLVTGNIFEHCTQQAILCTAGTIDCIITHNLAVHCGDASHDQILVDGVRNNVQNNTVRLALQPENVTGTARYGIAVAATGTDNLVTNNDLKSSGVTASFNDAGTATITVAGNRV